MSRIQKTSTLDAVDETARDTAWCVDDLKSNLDVIKIILDKLGLNVHTFTSPLDALTKFAASDEPPDIIFTDLWMDELAGDDFASRIKELPQGSSVPIIAVTVDEAPADRFNLEHFDKVIQKPITLLQLKKVLY